MHFLKIARLYFCLAALLFVAKPFLGFTMFTRQHPPAKGNIFIKSFTKRKVENQEEGSHSIVAFQKKLADPLTQFTWRFLCLLGILFPFGAVVRNIRNSFLTHMKFIAASLQRAYLLTGKLII